MQEQERQAVRALVRLAARCHWRDVLEEKLRTLPAPLDAACVEEAEMRVEVRGELADQAVSADEAITAAMLDALRYGAEAFEVAAASDLTEIQVCQRVWLHSQFPG